MKVCMTVTGLSTFGMLSFFLNHLKLINSIPANPCQVFWKWSNLKFGIGGLLDPPDQKISFG